MKGLPKPTLPAPMYVIFAISSSSRNAHTVPFVVRRDSNWMLQSTAVAPPL
jgi:hypothetical protein